MGIVPEMPTGIQNELLGGLPVMVCLIPEAEERTDDLLRARFGRPFPYDGWELVDDVSRTSDWQRWARRAARFWADAAARLGVENDDELLVTWDDSSWRTCTLPVAAFVSHLVDIVSQSSDCYVAPPDVSWCVCYTFEGWMAMARWEDRAPARWDMGLFDSENEAIQWSFRRHGARLGSATPADYLRDAQALQQARKGAKRTDLGSGNVLLEKQRRSIVLGPGGLPRCFGKQIGGNGG